MGWARYDYLFAISLIGAFIDAYGIGANDVANSFATSVSSKSLTFKQAMLAAAICEFAGAVLVGARVTNTIRNGIISLSDFDGDAAVLLLTFTCVIVASCTWLTIATRMAMPVSTTHTVIGAIIGAGIAARGTGTVRWGWNGVGQVFASWGIAPCVAGGFASIVFLITKFIVLKAKDPVKVGLFISPVYFFVVASVLTVAIIVKGSPSLNLDELPAGTTAAAVIGTGAVISLLSIIFWLPWVHAQVVKGDYTVKWYHFFQGPLLWRRVPPADAFTAGNAIPDYYRGHHEEDYIEQTNAAAAVSGREQHDVEQLTQRTPSHEDSLENKEGAIDGNSADEITTTANKNKSEKDMARDVEQDAAVANQKSKLGALEKMLSDPTEKTMPNGRPYPPKYRTFDGQWAEPWNMYTILRYNALPWVWYTLSAGLRTDVHKMQMHGSDTEKARLRNIHSHAAHYDNKAEHLFSFLQVLTACTASFAHGANDVSNAVGPLSVVYYVWSTQLFPGRSEATPVWILALGGAGIVIGLGTYGWKLMSVLGNRLTLHSPSRGFSMEFGASITVVLASYLGLPVSTTQSITGATVAVALCNGDWRSTNWKGVLWIFFSWVLTLPMAGIMSGCLLGIVLNAPRWGMPN